MKILLQFVFLFSTLLLQGCVTAAIVSTAAIGIKAATDPRTIGMQVDDAIIKFRVNRALDKDVRIKKDTRISVLSYQGKVLLVGQAPNKNLILRAKRITAEVSGVMEVYNEIRQEEPISFCAALSDYCTTMKVYTKLFGSRKVKFSNMKIITENGEVFLFGLVTRGEGKAAADIASRIKGAKHVVTAFSYIQ